MKRKLFICVIIIFVLCCGNGCQMARLKSLDLDMGGLELEYWEPEPAPMGAVGFVPDKKPRPRPVLMRMDGTMDSWD